MPTTTSQETHLKTKEKLNDIIFIVLLDGILVIWSVIFWQNNQRQVFWGF